MAKHLNLDEQLRQRKFKKPGWLYYFIFKIICFFIKKYLRGSIIIKDKVPRNGPFFLIFNHQSRLDYVWPVLAAKSRRLNFVTAYHEHFRKKFWYLFNLVHTIPKRNFELDLNALKSIKSIIKQNGAICFSPEGKNSYYGTNSPIIVGTGAFIKHFNIPVYLVKINGSYLTSVKHTKEIRRGKITAELSRLDLSKINDNDCDDYLNSMLRYDEYEWQEKQHIKWPSKLGMANKLHRVIYKCPKCGKEEMIGENNIIRCRNCNNGASIDNFYQLAPLDSVSQIFPSPSQWAKYERKEIVSIIRHNPEFQLVEDVEIGMLPKRRLLAKNEFSRKVGQGQITINHNGFTLIGEKDNTPFSVSLNYQQIFTIGLSPKMTTCFFYYRDELYTFTPKNSPTLKLVFLVEEMHRLHVNKWKNFSWENDIYKL